MPKLTLDRFNLGGLSDSRFSGGQLSMHRIVGWDLHSEPGLARVAQKMAKDSAEIVGEFVKVAVATSNGATYWFSSTTGKVYERTSGGSWSLVHTTSPAAGGAGCLGAGEYQGYLYWATESRLHRIPVTGLSNWGANAVNNWATFTNTDSANHPMVEISGVLYIGDKYYVSQVDGSTFSANALDLPQPFKIKCLGTINTDLLIGTYVADNVNMARVFRWNTWSVSWTDDVSVKEPGVNAFFPADNAVLCSVGVRGNIYSYDGASLRVFKRVQGDYSPTATAQIHPNAVANLDGRLLFGVSNKSGNPSLQGVYELGRFSPAYPLILSLPYPSSAGVFTNLEIGAILVAGNDLFISWKDTNAGTFGVDKLDYTKKYTAAYIESLVIKNSREEMKTFSDFRIDYASLPASTALALKARLQTDTAFGSALTMLNDTQRAQYVYEKGFQSTSLQLRVEATVNNNDAPTLEDITLSID